MAAILEKGSDVRKIVEAYGNGNSLKTCCDLMGLTVASFKKHKKYPYTWKKMKKARAEMIVAMTKEVVKQHGKGKLTYANISDWLNRVDRESFTKVEPKHAPKDDSEPSRLSDKLGDIVDSRAKRERSPNKPKEEVAKAPIAMTTSINLEEMKAKIAESNPD